MRKFQSAFEVMQMKSLIKKHAPPAVIAAARRGLALSAELAQHPAVTPLRFLWWKNPLIWWRISHRGNSMIKSPTPRNGELNCHRILVYSPETVPEHFLTLQIIARLLASAGHQIRLSHCRGIFERCVHKEMMPNDAKGVGAEFCVLCISTRFKLLEPAGIDGFSLENVITYEIREKARQIVDRLSDGELAGFSLDGIKLGQLCWHDLVLNQKLMLDTPLERDHRLYLRQHLRTTIATYLGMKDFLPHAGITDVLLYGQYASNIAVICAAQKAGVNWRLVANVNHLGVDRRRILIFHRHGHVWTSQMIAAWPAWRNIPLAGDEIEETGNDVLVRFGATSYTTYSPPKTRDQDAFTSLGLDRSRRLVVAFTSSLDEYQAEELVDEVLGFPADKAPERPYRDQIEWLKSLSQEIEKRNDLQLVIRIHPRESTNKRDRFVSRHLELLRNNLADLPPYVTVVWPEDPVSSYDLVEVADLVQVWSSTIGLESARLGVPVIKIFRGYESYPEGEFAISAATHRGVLSAMNEALGWTPDLDRLIRAWRFYGYSRFTSSIDLRDVIPEPWYSKLPPFRHPERARELERAILDEIPVWTVNREASGFAAKRLSRDEEAEAVKRQLRRIIHTVFTGEPPPSDVPLNIGTSSAGARDLDGSFAMMGAQCTYAWGGRLHTRYSPMCARLASLAAHNPALQADLAPAE